mmetsp:Transcript_67493/g.206710  ORF Transcript_67493/g.206710 Transcript_67493/m.206710 type:complete len:243 (+) Transcript_67493:207-935(+)
MTTTLVAVSFRSRAALLGSRNWGAQSSVALALLSILTTKSTASWPSAMSTVSLAPWLDAFTKSPWTGRPVCRRLASTRCLATSRSVSTKITTTRSSSPETRVKLLSRLASCSIFKDKSLLRNVPSNTNGFPCWMHRYIMDSLNLLATGCVNSTACSVLVLPSSHMYAASDQRGKYLRLSSTSRWANSDWIYPSLFSHLRTNPFPEPAPPAIQIPKGLKTGLALAVLLSIKDFSAERSNVSKP